MCEGLFRILPKHADESDPLKSRVGDCVVLVDDDHPWSEIERTAPFWRIVKFPGVDKAVLMQLIGVAVNDRTGELSARRTHRLGASVLARSSATVGEALAAIEKRPNERGVVGPPSGVIG